MVRSFPMLEHATVVALIHVVILKWCRLPEVFSRAVKRQLGLHLQTVTRIPHIVWIAAVFVQSLWLSLLAERVLCAVQGMLKVVLAQVVFLLKELEASIWMLHFWTHTLAKVLSVVAELSLRLASLSLTFLNIECIRHEGILAHSWLWRRQWCLRPLWVAALSFA